MLVVLTNPLDFPRLSTSRRQNCTLPKHSRVDHRTRWVVWVDKQTHTQLCHGLVIFTHMTLTLRQRR